MVKRYYSNAADDKLRLGSAFAEYVEAGAQQREARIGGGSSVLDEVYDRLQDNLSDDGKLHIAPGAFDTGGIHGFYTGLLGADGLVLTDATLTPPSPEPDIIEIEAKGQADFLGVPLKAEVRFTAPHGVVVAAGRYEYGERWAIKEIPWVALEEPFIRFYTPDQGAPRAAAVGGRLASAGAELTFRLPTAEGKWHLVGTFPEPYPGIRSFYQLAGGVDLVRILPEPFASLSGFGLQDVELVYDQEAGEVASIGFRITTGSPLTLLASLEMKDIIAQVTVLSPASPERATDWNVRGNFTLGEKDPGTVRLSATGPDLLLTGALVEGTLRIGDIVGLFAPGVDLGIPDELAVTEFESDFTPATGAYRVTCALNIGWPVTVGQTEVFTIESLQFAATGNATWSSGQLSGYVTIDPTGAAVPLLLFGSYATGTGWTFRVMQPPDTSFFLTDLFNQFLPDRWAFEGEDYPVADLGLTVAYTDGSWSFSGRTAEPWNVPFLDDDSYLGIYAEFALGYHSSQSKQGPPGYTVRLSTEISWHNIDIGVYAAYEPAKLEYGIRWGALEGDGRWPGERGPYLATLKFTENTTLGSMIETMVSWATGSQLRARGPVECAQLDPARRSVAGLPLRPGHPQDNSVAFRRRHRPGRAGLRPDRQDLGDLQLHGQRRRSRSR